jgi:hypothetical protein
MARICDPLLLLINCLRIRKCPNDKTPIDHKNYLTPPYFEKPSNGSAEKLVYSNNITLLI